MILAIVQARCSSSRLPKKVLQPILGKPMILHELERLQHSKCINNIVLATSVDTSDDELVEIVSQYVDVYRGSLDDVLDRYYQCAKEGIYETIVRITGDCPVIDWRLVDDVIKQHLEEKNEYTSLTEHYPDGLDTEVFQFSALNRSWIEAKLPSEREHVTQYIRKHPEIFRLGSRDFDKDLSSMRWTVDEPKDLRMISRVYEELYPKNQDFTMYDILQLLEYKPDIMEINKGIIRNEGLIKSLEKDKFWVKDKEK